MVCVFISWWEHPSSGCVLKQLKFSSDRLVEPEIQFGIPGYKVSDFSSTPCWFKKIVVVPVLSQVGLNKTLCGCFVAVTSTRQGRFIVMLFYVQEHPKAQPAVVMVSNASEETAKA